MSPLAWMFVGYTVVWTAIVLYVGNLRRRQATLAREIEELKAALEVARQTSEQRPPADSAG